MLDHSGTHKNLRGVRTLFTLLTSLISVVLGGFLSMCPERNALKDEMTNFGLWLQSFLPMVIWVSSFWTFTDTEHHGRGCGGA
jgi:choline-glycine betaine transporter